MRKVLKSEWRHENLQNDKARVTDEIELSAAALPIDWTMNLLKHCGEYLDLVPLHGYWDMLAEKNELADYTQYLAYTEQVDRQLLT